MQQRPNILLVMVDQLTAALTGAYGHPVVRTPNLDRLVADGVRFDAAYSNCPVCAPARGALLSGRYVSNCKTYDNASPWPDDMVTLPHYLTLAGYDAVLSGKMHFVGADQLHGFRQRFVHNIYPAISNGRCHGKTRSRWPRARSRNSVRRVGRPASTWATQSTWVSGATH